MAIEQKVWFNPKGSKPIGVVITKDSDGTRRAWIGLGMGRGAVEDANHIAGFGASFPLDAAEVLIRELGNKE